MTVGAAGGTESHDADSGGGPPRPFQVESYAGLLQFPRIPDGAQNTTASSPGTASPVLDAIIVPTIRSPEHLVSAVELARSSRCILVVLYTHDFPKGLSAVLGRLKHDKVNSDRIAVWSAASPARPGR